MYNNKYDSGGNLLQNTNTPNIVYAWESGVDNNSNVLGFQILSNVTDDYFPVGDIAFPGPRAPDEWAPNRGNTQPYNNYNLNALIKYVQMSNNLASYVLYVKNDPTYSKILNPSNFGQNDSNKWGSKIWGTTEAENSNNNQTEDYVMFGNVFGKIGSDDLPLGGNKYYAAIHKNYVGPIENNKKWNTSAADGTGIGNWNVNYSDNVNYTSYFLNTWMCRNKNPKFFFRDILPETIQAACCSSTNRPGDSDLCSYLKTNSNICDSLMTGKYCTGSNLTTNACNTWCKKDGNFCDTDLTSFCSNIETEYDLTSPSTSSITWDTYANKNILNATGIPLAQSESTNTPDSCQKSCASNPACTAFVYGGNNSCSLRQTNPGYIIDNSMYYSQGDTTSIKRNSTDDKIKKANTCACFKGEQYYINYFNTISSQYPPNISNMIKAASASKDKRCFYSNCIAADSIKSRDLKRGASNVCGDTNLQVCFQNVDSSGSALSNSTITEEQKINCTQNMSDSKIDTPPPKPNQPPPPKPNQPNTPKPDQPNTPKPDQPNTDFLTKYKWWITGGVVGFILFLLILVLLMKK